jgi:hypothetical protein
MKVHANAALGPAGVPPGPVESPGCGGVGEDRQLQGLHVRLI